MNDTVQITSSQQVPSLGTLLLTYIDFLELKATEKLLLQLVARRGRGNPYSYHTQEYLGRVIQIKSREGIRKISRKLEEKGYLTVIHVRGSDGTHLPNIYRINTPPVAELMVLHKKRAHPEIKYPPTGPCSISDIEALGIAQACFPKQKGVYIYHQPGPKFTPKKKGGAPTKEGEGSPTNGGEGSPTGVGINNGNGKTEYKTEGESKIKVKNETFSEIPVTVKTKPIEPTEGQVVKQPPANYAPMGHPAGKVKVITKAWTGKPGEEHTACHPVPDEFLKVGDLTPAKLIAMYHRGCKLNELKYQLDPKAEDQMKTFLKEYGEQAPALIGFLLRNWTIVAGKIFDGGELNHQKYGEPPKKPYFGMVMTNKKLIRDLYNRCVMHWEQLGGGGNPAGTLTDQKPAEQISGGVAGTLIVTTDAKELYGDFRRHWPFNDEGFEKLPLSIFNKEKQAQQIAQALPFIQEFGSDTEMAVYAVMDSGRFLELVGSSPEIMTVGFLCSHLKEARQVFEEYQAKASKQKKTKWA